MSTPDIKQHIKAAALQHGLDPALVEAIVLTESSGNPAATRYEPEFYRRYIQRDYKDPVDGAQRATSWGLMQIMGQVAREAGFKGSFQELLGVECGLNWGCKKLAQCVKKWAHLGLDHAIAAYNAGTPVCNNGNFRNQGYVDKVHKNLKKVKEAKT